MAFCGETRLVVLDDETCQGQSPKPRSLHNADGAASRTEPTFVLVSPEKASTGGHQPCS